MGSTTVSMEQHRVQTNDALHQALRAFNARRTTPRLPTQDWVAGLEDEYNYRILEGRFIESERSAIAAVAAKAPHDAKAFVRWFEELRQTGPGQHDPLFPWLSRSATMGDMIWFLQQEMAGEAGFDDLVALTQVRMPTQAKLELARNYWDEMGQGKRRGMHGPMLERLAEELHIDASSGAEIVWESLALSNLMTGLASNRTYAYHSIGALGVIELTAPDRSAHVNEGLRRLGIGGAARQYYALHATLDVKHSAAWNAEVLHPLVAANPSVARAIAEGALMRLRAGARCFERYRKALWGHPSVPATKQRAS